ncbi:hypothetical protein D3C86_1324350 [compost metagenome]
MALRVASDEIGVGETLAPGASAGGGDQGDRDVQPGALSLRPQPSGGGQGGRARAAADVEDVAGVAGPDRIRQQVLEWQEQAVQQFLLLDPGLSAARIPQL